MTRAYRMVAVAALADERIILTLATHPDCGSTAGGGTTVSKHNPKPWDFFPCSVSSPTQSRLPVKSCAGPAGRDAHWPRDCTAPCERDGALFTPLRLIGHVSGCGSSSTCTTTLLGVAPYDLPAPREELSLLLRQGLTPRHVWTGACLGLGRANARDHPVPDEW